MIVELLRHWSPPFYRDAGRPPADGDPPGRSARNHLHLIVSPRYISRRRCAMAVAQAGFSAYSAGLSFVFISVHGLTPGRLTA